MIRRKFGTAVLIIRHQLIQKLNVCQCINRGGWGTCGDAWPTGEILLVYQQLFQFYLKKCCLYAVCIPVPAN